MFLLNSIIEGLALLFYCLDGYQRRVSTLRLIDDLLKQDEPLSCIGFSEDHLEVHYLSGTDCFEFIDRNWVITSRDRDGDRKVEDIFDGRFSDLLLFEDDLN